METVSQCYNSTYVMLSARLCENYVHGSTALTTNGMASLESKYLSARRELSRRVPIEFSQSLSASEASVFPTPYEKQILRLRIRMTLRQSLMNERV